MDRLELPYVFEAFLRYVKEAGENNSFVNYLAWAVLADFQGFLVSIETCKRQARINLSLRMVANAGRWIGLTNV